MIEAIIFDFDGLLADTEGIAFEIYQKLLKKHKFSLTIDMYVKDYSGKTDTENMQKIIKDYNLPYTLQEGLYKAAELEKEIMARGVNLKPGTKELLAYLKSNHYKIAVATSSFKERVVNIFEDHNILDYFDVFTCLEDVIHSKPHPEVFLKALKMLNTKKENAIILEDSENGILAANNASIPVICIPDMKMPASEYLDKTLAVYRSLNDVKDYLIGSQNNTPTLYTKRLILRKFGSKDMQAFFEIFQDKRVNEFLPWFPLKNIEEAKKFYKERYQTVYDQEQGYAYAICLKEDNVPIGYINIDMNESHDLGYDLKHDFWNKGIITEACLAIIEQAKKDHIPFITATHDINNPRSGHVMKNIGMKYCYSYEESWQPKNKLVTFRMYQLNLDEYKNRVYKKYWNTYKTHFIEKDTLKR